MKNKTILLLLVIFIISLGVRFYAFKKSTYFGYDEARDAFISQSIYLDKDIKIVGPPASNQSGINHGVLFWYFIGPLYLLGNGDPLFVSAILRIINALGVFLIYFVAAKLFDKKAGLLSAVIYAFSFEQTQYAMYVGNPSLAGIAWLVIILGAFKYLKEKKNVGILIMLTGAALAMQLDFFLIYTFLLVAIFIFSGGKQITKIKSKYWIYSLISVLTLTSTFIISEFKYQFQTTKGLMGMLTRGYNLIQPSENRFMAFAQTYLSTFRYNVINTSDFVLLLVIAGILIYLFLNRKEISVRIVLIWISASLLILPFGMGEALYFNIGVGLGLIVAVSYILTKLLDLSRFVYIVMLFFIVLSNLIQVKLNNPKGLLTSIKPQPYMLLNDEITLINSIYQAADGKKFTIRVTGIPFNVQTVWAYLFNQYGKKHYGYLPYIEGGNIEGFPGYLPPPQSGTTCVRFLIQEPARGIPVNLIEQNIGNENDFSEMINEKKFGSFLLQSRRAADKHCNE